MTKKMSRFLAATLSLIMLLACAAGALADETVYLTKVNITPASVTLTIGGSEDLSVTVEPYNTTQTAVLFSSSNTMVATVNSAGRVTGVSAGFAVIYATSVDNPYMIAACSVTVLESTKVSMNYSSLFLSPGFTSDLTATVTPYEIASQGVRFSSSNPSVAVVSNDGSGTTTVTAVGAGTATIYATAADGTMGTTSVTVGTKVNKISVKPTSITINTGSQTSVSASVEPANASNTSVKWSSSDTNVATVDSYGNVTTWCAGSAAIIATAQDGTGLTASCYIEVKGVDVTHPPTAVPTATPVPPVIGWENGKPTGSASAEYPYQTVTIESVNLRKKASTSSTRLLTIPKGASITVSAMEGDFLQVTYQTSKKSYTGYVLTRYVDVPAVYLGGKSLAEDAEAQKTYGSMSQGASGNAVSALQDALRELGYYSTASSGTYDSATVLAIKAFQSKNGLLQTGIASAELQKLIFEGKPLNARGARVSVAILPPVDGVTMRSGDVGYQVTELQQNLKSLGYYEAAVTGSYDAATVAAVKTFQRNYGLTADGIAGPKMLAALDAVIMPTAAPVITVAATPPPAPITAEETETVQRLAERVSAALMVDAYCRCDFLWDTQRDEFYCLEANTLPGMTPTSLIPQEAAANGMSFHELCEKLIQISM